mgnify:CR=1 FL=1
MNRRGFLQGASAAGLAGLAGCASMLEGGSDETTTTTEEAVPVNFRVEFVDEAGTLGHVAGDYSAEDEAHRAVNEVTEEQWQEFKDNDVNFDSDLQENLDTFEQFGEYALGMRSDLPGFDPQEIQAVGSYGQELVPEGTGSSADLRNVRESDIPDAEKLVWAAGFATHELGITGSSAESHDTVLPAVEHLHDELLDDEGHLNTISLTSREPEASDYLVHRMGALTYDDGDGGLALRYFEPTLGGGTPPSYFRKPIRHPDESIYADPDVDNAVTPLEYTKMVRMLENGSLQTDGPDKALASRSIRGSLWGFVDAFDWGNEDDTPETRYTEQGISSGQPLAPNYKDVYREVGAHSATVSPRFGRSVEEHFDNYSREVEETFENLGRGVEAFYRAFGDGAPIGIGGTIENPEFYRLSAEK